MSGQTVIELKNLSFIRNNRALIHDFSIAITKGSANVVIGIAGSGKTTFLKAAAGLLIPDSGSLLIHGKPFSGFGKKETDEFRKTNGFVFQDAALWANRTIEENLRKLITQRD